MPLLYDPAEGRGVDRFAVAREKIRLAGGTPVNFEPTVPRGWAAYDKGEGAGQQVIDISPIPQDKARPEGHPYNPMDVPDDDPADPWSRVYEHDSDTNGLMVRIEGVMRRVPDYDFSNNQWRERVHTDIGWPTFLKCAAARTFV